LVGIIAAVARQDADGETSFGVGSAAYGLHYPVKATADNNCAAFSQLATYFLGEPGLFSAALAGAYHGDEKFLFQFTTFISG
jgi:hypothetical protein